MKFENHILRKAEDIRVGDKVCFDRESANYVVTDVQWTQIGMVRHQHKTGSNAYWPHELVYVESFATHRAEIIAALVAALGINKDTPVQVGQGKIMPFSRAVQYCRPGLAIRLPGHSRNLVERTSQGWYY